MFDTGTENAIPFWGARTKTANGYDPLEIQNSSTVIYTGLIPGITNVTTRIRYMGFYCWLLNRLLKELENKKATTLSKKEQISLLRKSELLLAYIMHANYLIVDSSSTTGIGGSKYAGDNFNIHSAGVDLKKGEKSYWSNEMGVFGQYYVGAMQTLGLILSPDNGHHWYRCKKAGLSLAAAFEKNITTEIGDKFIDCVVRGYAELKYLTGIFKTFALHEIPDGEELDIYRKLILGKDSEDVPYSTCYRSQTIQLILNSIELGAKSGQYKSYNNFVLPFLQENFENVLSHNLEVAEVKKLWFIYELNELLHYCFESFHSGLLYYLTEEPQSLNAVFDLLLEELEIECEERNAKVVSDLDDGSSIHKVYENMKKTKFVNSRLCYGIQLLYLLNKNTCIYLDEFLTQRIGTEPVKREGCAPILLPALIGDKEREKIQDVVKDILFKAINRHTRSSFEKSSPSKGIVNNYLIDDGFIWKLRELDATRTNPRIKNTLMYLIDMRLVTVTKGHEYLQLTDEGEKILGGTL